MDHQQHIKLADALLPDVLAAGRLEMSHFQTSLHVETKADRSPVTVADRQAEAILLKALERELPGLPAVAEEAFAEGARPNIGSRFLLVDALDGTKQFVSGQREFTINIALVENGVPIFGLIYAPALSDLLITAGPRQALRARIGASSGVDSLAAAGAAPIQVRSPPPKGITALQSRSRNVEMSDAYLADFPVAEKRRLGSSYKFCLIASGEADIYTQLGDTREWDTAAGHAILVAAGGCVTTMTGEPLVYAKSETEYLNPQFIASSLPVDRLKLAA